MTDAVTSLGRVGVWTGVPGIAPAAVVRETVQEIEELGYGAIWWGEAVAKESFSSAALLLSWTSRIVAATGISNVYARDPMASRAGAATLGEAFPGRFVLGLGCSHHMVVEARGQTYRPPLRTMREYLDGMDAANYLGPEPEVPVPVVLAALGPKMLDLSRDRADGAHPYFVPVEHTAIARERLGPGKLLAVEQAVILTSDEVRARELSREYASFYLTAPNYRNNMRRLGFDDADMEGGGSDRLRDSVVVWGDESAIRERVRAHLDAGADHVCIQTLPSGKADLESLRCLAPALLDL